MNEKQEYQLMYERCKIYENSIRDDLSGIWHDATITAENEKEAMLQAINYLDKMEMRSASAYVNDAHIILPDKRQYPVPGHCQKNKDIDTIIFDIGDVLVKGSHRKAITSLGEQYAKNEYPAWQEYKTGKCTEQEYWQKVLSNTQLQGHEKSIAEFMRAIFKNCQKGDAHRFLEPLKKQNYQIAVLSNHSTEWAQIISKQLELEKYCNPILISADIRLEKPEPAIYEYTLNAVNRKNEPYKCYFIDDLLSNVQEARRAGMHAFHFKEQNGQSPDKLLEKELQAYRILKSTN